MRNREPLPTRCEPFTDGRERVAQLLADGCAALPENETGHDAPSVGTVRALLERVTTDRLTKRERAKRPRAHCWRFLRNARTRDDIGRVFLQRLRWHHGTHSPNLWSVYGGAFDVGRVNFETIDTVAAVFTHLFGRDGLNRSHSTVAWARVFNRTTTETAARNYRNRYERKY